MFFWLDGEFQPGQRVSFKCKVDGEAAEAKYLAIYVDGRSALLQICNLEVYEWRNFELKIHVVDNLEFNIIYLHVFVKKVNMEK